MGKEPKHRLIKSTCTSTTSTRNKKKNSDFSFLLQINFYSTFFYLDLYVEW